jgi:ABC-type multidrug transport system fused ATPase/permease subunit
MVNGSKALRLYISYYLRYPKMLAANFLLGPAYVLQFILPALFIAKALGTLVATQHIAWGYIWAAAASMIFGAVSWRLLDRYVATQIHSNVMRDMYDDCFRQVLKQDYDFFANNFSGSLVTNANRFAKAFEMFNVNVFLDTLGPMCGVIVASPS